METISGGPGGTSWWDKVPSKFTGWDNVQFAQAGFRAVPGAIVRRGAFIGRNAVLKLVQRKLDRCFSNRGLVH